MCVGVRGKSVACVCILAHEYVCVCVYKTFFIKTSTENQAPKYLCCSVCNLANWNTAPENNNNKAVNMQNAMCLRVNPTK